MTQNTFDLADYSDVPTDAPVTMRATLEANRVCVEEIPADGRGVIVEQTGGVIKLRVFSADKQNPICIALDPQGGVSIDRTDFDKEVTPDNMLKITGSAGSFVVNATTGEVVSRNYHGNDYDSIVRVNPNHVSTPYDPMEFGEFDVCYIGMWHDDGHYEPPATFERHEGPDDTLVGYEPRFIDPDGLKPE